MNRDGSHVRRLTNNPAIDITPTWSPSGNQIAFTSDRSGTPADLHHGRRRPGRAADHDRVGTATGRPGRRRRSTRSPTPRGPAPGYDIKVYSLPTAQSRQITFGEGSNESPAFAPNGRHIAFTSTRSGQAADLHDRPRRQGPAADHARAATTTIRTGRNSDCRFGDGVGGRSVTSDEQTRLGSAVLVVRRWRWRGACGEEEAAGRAADAAAAAAGGHDRAAAAGAARAGARRTRRSRRSRPLPRTR